MNVLRKSSMTVIVVTAIASILIVSTNKVVADSSRTNVEIVNKKEAVVTDLTIKNDEVVKEHNHSVELTSNIANKEKESDIRVSAPPPGPFTLLMIDVDAPSSPKAPVNTADVEPASPIAPKLNSAKVDQPTLGILKPEFKREMPSISNVPVIDSITSAMKQSKPKLANSVGEVKTNEPIWMQKPPINSASSGLQATVGKSVPKQMKAPVYSVYGTQQRYIYVPMPLYPTNYGYSGVPNYGAYYYPQLNNVPYTPKQIMRNHIQNNPAASDAKLSKPQASMEN